MGLFDKNDKGLFDGLFDFNGDGKTSFIEEYRALKMFEVCIEEQMNNLPKNLFDDEDDSDDYEWRENCDDGLEYGVDPEDYETEEEYEEALEEAKYEWREDCDDGLEYGVDPEDYETEEEYEEALEEAKYEWRENCDDGLEYGVDPEDYETEDEYEEALEDKIEETRRKKRSKKQRLDETAKIRNCESDKTIYTYCGVLLPFSSRPYSFITEDKTIHVGDTVVVPIGKDEKEMKGKVVSIGQYLRFNAPYPVEKTKKIIRKSEEEPENG
jgi:hypothetical protein